MTPRPHTPRRALEDAIEALIAVLDLIEPDPDLESTGDEQDQSYPHNGGNFRGGYLMEDAEDDDPGEDSDPAEDCGDDEPEEGL